jgi:zinc transporter, ZIP family
MHTGVAFGMTILTEFATGIGIGCAIAFFAPKTNTRFLVVALGFSAGVMIYVSLVELLAKARTALSVPLGTYVGSWLAVVSFFVGIAVIALIDKLLPSFENPHEMHTIEEMGSSANTTES